MPTFVYKGRNRANEVVSGERTAENREALEKMLKREQVVMTNVREKGREFALPKFGGGGKVNAKELSVFTRQFSVMIDAGLPLVQCLDILASQQPNKFFAQAIASVQADVEGGSTLAAAMEKQPKVFDRLYTNMVAAGETGGILDNILQRLSIYIEKAVKLKSEIKGAMTYPVIVVVMAVVVIAVIMIFVIPSFAKIFKELLGESEGLPLPTMIVVAMSDFLAAYWWLAAIIIGSLFAAFKWYYSTPAGNRNIDKIALKLPIFGDIMRKVAVARFSRTLSTLLTSGVAILEALDITARTAGNVIIQEAIMSIRMGVERGQTLVEPLNATKVFPSMVSQMVGIGEQTGALDTMLGKIADFYEQEVDAAVANLLTLIEPLMIGFLGISIGGIVIAMYLPLFTLIGKMSNKG